MRRIEELKKLIQEYRFLCEEANRMTAITTCQQTPSPSAWTENTNTANLTPSRSKSCRKIKTQIFCSNCETNFLPQEYYRHCKECHNGSASMTLRS